MKSYFYSQLNEEASFDEQEFLKRVDNIIDTVKIPDEISGELMKRYVSAKKLKGEQFALNLLYRAGIHGTLKVVKNEIKELF
jgi:hypothetical protein